VLLDEAHAHAALCGIARDTRAVDAAADDDDVVRQTGVPAPLPSAASLA
jgi:hypothetical protein